MNSAMNESLISKQSSLFFRFAGKLVSVNLTLKMQLFEFCSPVRICVQGIKVVRMLYSGFDRNLLANRFVQYRMAALTLKGGIAVAFLGCVSFSSIVAAQPPRPAPGKEASKATPPRKLTEAEKAAQAVLNAYTDAANFQNSGAFPLAIEAWQKLLKNFPKDPLASKAQHYLGLCYLRVEEPNFELAAKYLRAALEDKKLEVREEALVELGRALSQSAMQSEGSAKKQKYEEASKVFAIFLESYGDGSYADQALFYAGEAEYQLGRFDRAANLFRRLTDMPAMAKSALRPDAIFSLGVAYEQLKQAKLAIEAYEAFLKTYPKHRLVPDVRLRLAEQLVAIDKPQEAIEHYEAISKNEGEMQDYVLHRYGYALAKAGKFAESSAVYKLLGEKFPNSTYATGASLAAGQALMRDKNYEQAALYFRRLLPNKDHTASEAAHLLCQIALMKGPPSDAIAISREALEWSSSSPRFVALKMDLAEALATVKESQAESRVLFEQIATEHPDDPLAPRAAYNAAFGALQTGQLADAQRWGEQFAQKYPTDPLAPDVAYVVAESTLQIGQFAEAATAFEQLVAGQKEHPSRELWELRLGHARFMGNQFDEAISKMIKLSQNTKDVPVKAEALFLVGASLLRQEKFREAEDAIQQSLRVAPKGAQADEAHLLLSQAQIRADKTKEARVTLERLIKEFPNSRFRNTAELRLGQLTASTGDYDQAIASYDAILQGNQDKNIKDVAVYGKAWVLMQKKEFADAAKLLEPLAVIDRKDSIAAEAALLQAICFRNLRKAKESIEILERLVAEPTVSVPLSKSLYELGVSYIELKEFHKASETFDRILKEFPKLENLDKILYEFAWSLKEQDRAAEAGEIFHKLSRAFPNSQLAAEADYHLGQRAYEESAFDRAVIAYTSAVTRTKDAELQEKSIYKLGWAYYQQKDYEQASTQFAKQARAFPDTALSVEAVFMQAECMKKLDNFAQAFTLYQQARKSMEKPANKEAISEQIRTLNYLHGAQSARELKKWEEVDAWLDELLTIYPETTHKPFILYERAYSAQNQKNAKEAVKLFEEVASNNRNEIGARSRFMIGELYFAERDFAKAVPEFEKVMYGYGATQAPNEVKNWQARAAMEAGRCSELLIGDLAGQKKAKAIRIAKNFYQNVVDNHPQHQLVGQAKERIAALDKITK
jgi:cellulose synthase operon protein C